jgi:hypothetical protein
MTTRTTARDRQKAKAADRAGIWVLQLAEAIDRLGTNLAGKLTRTERAQMRRVGRLMLAAADGVSSGVLLAAILELAAVVLVQVEVRRGLEAWRRRMPVRRPPRR